MSIDQEGWLHQPLHDARAMRALGLVYLLNRPNKFWAIADAKTAFLTARYPFGLRAFLEMRSALEHQID